MLIGTQSMLRPLQQVLCTLVINHKLHKLSAKYAVCAATDDVNVMRRRRVCCVCSTYS